MRLADDAMQRELESLKHIEVDELAVRRVRDRLRDWANDRRYTVGSEDRWRMRVMAGGFVALVVTLVSGVWQRQHETAGQAPVVAERAPKLDLTQGSLRLDIRLDEPTETFTHAAEHHRVASEPAPMRAIASVPLHVEPPAVTPDTAPSVEREDALYLSLIHALRAGHADEARDIGLNVSTRLSGWISVAPKLCAWSAMRRIESGH